MPHTSPNPDIDFQQISTRNDQARHIVAGCAGALPTLTDMWRHIEAALDDTVALSAHVARLSAELDLARLDRANLRAAMRAALAAHADGEPDSMWYLRDELNAPQATDAASRRRE
jgi:hypothetical protein